MIYQVQYLVEVEADSVVEAIEKAEFDIHVGSTEPVVSEVRR